MIAITQLADGSFNVVSDDRIAPDLSFAEMIGLVAALTMPPIRRELDWLRTMDEHRASAKRGARGVANEAPIHLGDVVLTTVMAEKEGDIVRDVVVGIRRANVVFNVGDKVTLRNGGESVVSHFIGGHEVNLPVALEPGSCYTLTGRYWSAEIDDPRDIISINNTPIID